MCVGREIQITLASAPGIAVMSWRRGPLLLRKGRVKFISFFIFKYKYIYKKFMFLNQERWKRRSRERFKILLAYTYHFSQQTSPDARVQNNIFKYIKCAVWESSIYIYTREAWCFPAKIKIGPWERAGSWAARTKTGQHQQKNNRRYIFLKKESGRRRRRRLSPTGTTMHDDIHESSSKSLLFFIIII